MEGPCPCPSPRTTLHGTWVPSSAPGSSSLLPSPSSHPPPPPPVCFALPHYVPALTDELQTLSGPFFASRGLEAHRAGKAGGWISAHPVAGQGVACPAPTTPHSSSGTWGCPCCQLIARADHAPCAEDRSTSSATTLCHARSRPGTLQKVSDIVLGR